MSNKDMLAAEARSLASGFERSLNLGVIAEYRVDFTSKALMQRLSVLTDKLTKLSESELESIEDEQVKDISRARLEITHLATSRPARTMTWCFGAPWGVTALPGFSASEKVSLRGPASAFLSFDNALKRASDWVQKRLPAVMRRQLFGTVCDMRAGELAWVDFVRAASQCDGTLSIEPVKYTVNAHSPFDHWQILETISELESWYKMGGEEYCCGTPRFLEDSLDACNWLVGQLNLLDDNAGRESDAEVAMAGHLRNFTSSKQSRIETESELADPIDEACRSLSSLQERIFRLMTARRSIAATYQELLPAWEGKVPQFPSVTTRLKAIQKKLDRKKWLFTIRESKHQIEWTKRPDIEIRKEGTRKI